jgi:CysZ protein
MTGIYPACKGRGVVKDMMESFAFEGNRFLYFALRALPILLLFFIPLINFAAPFIWMLFGAWSLSSEYMAYPLQAQGIRFDEQRTFMQQRRFDMLLFGGWVMLGLAIPVLNILIPPAAVIGATLYVCGGESTEARNGSR